MKKLIYKKTIITLLVLLLPVSIAFAGGNKEIQVGPTASNNTVSDNSVSDNKTGTIKVSEEDISKNKNVSSNEEKVAYKNDEITAFMNEWNSYTEKYDEIIAKMDMAYDKNDAISYRDAKSELYSLQKPVLTKDRSDLISSSLSAEDYENANWLFTHSSYYQPVLKFISNSEGFSYNSSFSSNPGSDVKVPTIKGPNGKLLFQGWATQENGNVLYKAGETIKMPVQDLTLYAVFAPNPEIIEGKHIKLNSITVKDSEGLNLPRGMQVGVKAELKNIGSEDLSNLEIKFESDDPLFVILNDTLYCYFLRCSEDVVARFRVITKAPTGTELKGKITVSNSDGVLWTEDVVFSVL